MKARPSKIDVYVDEQAIEKAERELNPPPSNWERPVFVPVPLKWITARSDLFRVPDLDLEYVEDLVARIARNESIDPPLVVKIGGKWICVDGHHRIAAHRKLESHTVKSEWFDGTVREAADEHLRTLRRNEVNRHSIQQGRAQQAPRTK
jgi:hypothetical protein